VWRVPAEMQSAIQQRFAGAMNVPEQQSFKSFEPEGMEEKSTLFSESPLPSWAKVGTLSILCHPPL
jgi:hypothetical protein